MKLNVLVKWVACLALPPTSVLTGRAQVYEWQNFSAIPATASTPSTDGPLGTATFRAVSGFCTDSAGNIYVSDLTCIRKITPQGMVSTLAGGNISGMADGAGTNATFNFPRGLAADSAGNIFVADGNNHSIRKITPQGVVSTFAGASGQPGNTDGQGSAARLHGPAGLTIDTAGNLFVAELSNDCIRRISPGGQVERYAGILSGAGNTNGPRLTARFRSPMGVSMDVGGAMFVSEAGGNRVRRITASGNVESFAGDPNGASGSANGQGSLARFDLPGQCIGDGFGNCYVADTGNHTIRKITNSGLVSTVGGIAGSPGNSRGLGLSATFRYPDAIGLSRTGGSILAGDQTDTVIIGRAPSPQLIRNPTGTNSLFWRVGPGTNWEVQKSTNLRNWQKMFDASAGADGAINFTDSAPPSGAGFYRLKFVQVSG